MKNAWEACVGRGVPNNRSAVLGQSAEPVSLLNPLVLRIARTLQEDVKRDADVTVLSWTRVWLRQGKACSWLNLYIGARGNWRGCRSLVRAQPGTAERETTGQALLSFPTPSPRTQRKLGRSGLVSNEIPCRYLLFFCLFLLNYFSSLAGRHVSDISARLKAQLAGQAAERSKARLATYICFTRDK